MSCLRQRRNCRPAAVPTEGNVPGAIWHSGLLTMIYELWTQLPCAWWRLICHYFIECNFKSWRKIKHSLTLLAVYFQGIFVLITLDGSLLLPYMLAERAGEYMIFTWIQIFIHSKLTQFCSLPNADFKNESLSSKYFLSFRANHLWEHCLPKGSLSD